MKPFTLVGVDPGINDTGFVAIHFDPDNKKFGFTFHVWHNVSRMVGEQFIVDKDYLHDLQRLVLKEKLRAEGGLLTAVEGYRPRGRNMRQDQQMTMMVKETHAILKGGNIVDNTGVRKVITDATLRLFDFRFPRTYHSDLESAARIALRFGSKNTAVNKVLATFIIDMVDGPKWERVPW